MEPWAFTVPMSGIVRARQHVVLTFSGRRNLISDGVRRYRRVPQLDRGRIADAPVDKAHYDRVDALLRGPTQSDWT